MTYSGYIRDHPVYCLDHQCPKFHVFKYITIERKFQTFPWQRKKSFLTDDRKKKNPIRQIRLNDKYQCWYEDKHTRPWGSLFIFPRGIYEIRSTGSMIRSITCLYELLYNYLWYRLLHPNSAKNSGVQRDRELGPKISPPT